MRPANSILAPRLPRRRKRYVVVGKHLTPLSRVLVLARRWKWLGVILGLGMTAIWGWWFGRRYQWGTHLRNHLSDELRAIANPANLPEVLLGVGLLVVLALWWLPKGQAAWSQGANEKNYFDRENEARKTLAQIIAGVFVLAGLYSSVNTFNLQQQGQITDRFTKAIDQLGALAPSGGVDQDGRPKINLEVRLGGIYALERIAKDSPKDHWTIMEVLTAYVRENAPLRDRAKPSEVKLPQGERKQPGHVTPLKRPVVRADIQAILTVIGRRNTRYDPPLGFLDLRRANLSGADLNYADLHLADLFKSDLTGAFLFHAYLRNAYLPEVVLYQADFTGADLGGAELTETDLSSADLSTARDLTQKQLANTFGDKNTKLPLGLVPPKSWSK